MNAKVWMIAVLAGAIVPLTGSLGLAHSLQDQLGTLSANRTAQLARATSLDNTKKLNIQVSYFIGSNLIGNLGKDPTLSDGIPFWELVEITTSPEGKKLTKFKDIETAEKIADQAITLSRQALAENPGQKESIRQLIISIRNRATLYGMNRQYDRAEQQYAEALNQALSPDAKHHRIPLATELFNRLGLLSEMRGNDKQAEEFYLGGYKFALSISPKVTGIVVRQWQTAELDNASGKPTNVIQHTSKVPNINYEDEGFFNLCLNLAALYERQNKYKEAVFFTWTASKHAYENNSRRLTRPDIHELVRSRMFRVFARLTPDDIRVLGGRTTFRSFIGREYDLKLQNIFLNSLLSYKSAADLTQQTTNSLITLALRFKTNVQGNNLSEYEIEPFALRRALISKARLLDSDEKQRSQKCLEDNTPSTVKNLCRQLYQNYEALSRLVFTQQQGNSPNSFVTRYQDLNNQISSLKQQIQRADFSTYEPKTELKDFQALIPKDAALVEIVKYQPPKAQPKFNDWWDEWHYAAVVFKANGNPQWVDLGKAAEIETSVSKFRTALSTPSVANSSMSLAGTKRLQSISTSSTIAQTQPITVGEAIKKLKKLIEHNSFEEAVPLIEALIAATRKDAAKYPNLFSNLLRYRAFLYQIQRQDKQAEAAYNEALKVLGIRVDYANATTTLPKNYSSEVTALFINLAQLAYRKNQYEDALIYLKQANDHEREAEKPVVKGFTLADTRFDPAIRSLVSMIFIKRGWSQNLTDLFSSERFNTDVESLLTLSFTDSLIEQRTSVDSFYLENTLGIDFILTDANAILHELSAQANSLTIAALQTANKSPSPASISQLALTQQLILKARSLDVMAKSLQKCNENANLRDRCQEWITANTKLSALSYQTQSSVDAVNRYRELSEKSQDLADEIKRDSLMSGKELVWQQVDLPSVQAQLPQKAALVEIMQYRPLKDNPQLGNYWGDRRYAAAVLHPTGAPKWVDLGNAPDVEASVAKFRNNLANRDAEISSATNPRSLAAVQQAGRDLDQRVMAKIRPLLGDAKHLLISADGELNLVPFEALRDETGKYLIERYQFSYLTSGRDLLSIAESRKNPPRSRQDAVILADPDYYQPTTPVVTTPANPPQRPNGSLSGGNTASVDSLLPFDKAPGTAQLAQALKSKILPTATVLTQATATKTALQKSPSPRILVLATHGFFVPNPEKEIESVQPGGLRPTKTLIKIENPLLRSGLALAGVNRNLDSSLVLNEDNGILTALEVAGLDLRGTQLVVLSACETGVGEAKVGDGVYGLRRALVIAGAQSQVLSLWKVDDAATKDLMVDYFTRMNPPQGQGEGRHAALQAAKLAMLKGSDPQRRHPYYWAGFIASGDWAPLSK